MKLQCNYRIWQIELTVQQAEWLIKAPSDVRFPAWWESNFTVLENNLRHEDFDEVELIYERTEPQYPPVLIFRTGPAKAKRTIKQILSQFLGIIPEPEAP